MWYWSMRSPLSSMPQSIFIGSYFQKHPEGGRLSDLSLCDVTRSNQSFWLSKFKYISTTASHVFLRHFQVLATHNLYGRHRSFVLWTRSAGSASGARPFCSLEEAWCTDYWLDNSNDTMKIHIKLRVLILPSVSKADTGLTTVRQHGGVKKIESIPLSELNPYVLSSLPRLYTLQRRHTMVEL